MLHLILYPDRLTLSCQTLYRVYRQTRVHAAKTELVMLVSNLRTCGLDGGYYPIYQLSNSELKLPLIKAMTGYRLTRHCYGAKLLGTIKVQS